MAARRLPGSWTVPLLATAVALAVTGVVAAVLVDLAGREDRLASLLVDLSRRGYVDVSDGAEGLGPLATPADAAAVGGIDDDFVADSLERHGFAAGHAVGFNQAPGVSVILVVYELQDPGGAAAVAAELARFQGRAPGSSAIDLGDVGDASAALVTFDDDDGSTTQLLLAVAHRGELVYRMLAGDQDGPLDVAALVAIFAEQAARG